ncbi:Asp-tRNA(Asn)/Glu-tRNA(Gln) amidotransferase subunit GatB [Anaerorhabdus furcosa]|uniref:Aspartyl/glutamyl-tRNA(Asn/Gln) amidotransferase subunit B n=1 Tax=Anaerorhabdus furcosa TaxID=118967 RepID=A0A1T4JUS7_9FIRM|nr:Asp-tRNA(Asn)/Glu-tRNA(Gln) amidotransferase subunit GatB [Anaerorhabdus furcosa]SJZ33817.1 aspartyl/glutamyl-tRNA(Asn/Gln) amidotransferase subunit B [Anaerorhabdus furcosa]
MEYDVVIGIEIHCELNTNSKMFSSSPTTFGKLANSCVNEIDLAHPGTLPCVNKGAVEQAIKACTALHLEIDPVVKFDRKNYYYSDLPKGFQITQQFFPIGKEGHIEIETSLGKKKIRINRIHMEEDTAKQFHLTEGTLIDFNRAGTPLIEIVSEPDMTNGEEAAAYVEALRQTLYYLGVSDVKMEEGSMRCDVNISLMPKGSTVYGVKNEIKNLNSISNVQKAIDYEIERQAKILDEGGIIEQATRRFDEATKSTILMRLKEGNVDYKFFPEPNIVPIRLEDAWIKSIQANLPELPEQRRARYQRDYQLSAYDINVFLANKELAEIYEEVMKTCKNAKLACNWMITDVLAWLGKNNVQIPDLKMKPEDLATMVNMIENGDISGKQAKEVFEDVMLGKNPNQIVEEKGLKQVSDTSMLESLINEVLDEQPQSIEDYRNGKDRAVGFLVGQVMKKSKGQANPAMTNKMIVEELNKRIK